MSEAARHYDHDAEAAVLGCLLAPSANGARDAGDLRPEDFYRLAHGLIFRACQCLAEDGRRIDPITVSDHLEAADQLDAAGGRAFVHSLPAAVPSVANLSAYVEVVGRCSRRRGEVEIGRALEAGSLNLAEALAALETLERRGQRAAGLPFQTASELAAAEAEAAPGAIVRDLLFEASVHDLVAKPKAGKTSFCLALATAVVNGAPFLGRATRKTPVVYLTEERAPSFRDALERVGLLGHPDLHLLLRQDAFSTVWPTVMQGAVNRAADVGAGLLVVDTLGDWASLAGDEENSAGATLEAMRPLQRAAAGGLCVLLSRHDRKGEPKELGDAGRGSNAIAGASDVLMSLRRTAGQGHDNRRELAVLGRFSGLPPLLVLEWAGDGYVSLGEHADVEFREMQTRILDHLPPAGAEGIRESDLLEAIREADPGASRTTLRRALEALRDAGQVYRDGTGRKGSPYTYRLAEEALACVSP